MPQGSILGPLLFLLFITHIPLTIGNTVTSTDLYADDTTLYDIQKSKDLLRTNLNKSLYSLERLCLNGMQLNTDKTKVIFIATAQRKRALPDCKLKLNYKDILLGQCSGEKPLGIYFQDNLKWDTHIEHVCKKVASYIWLLYRIRDFLTVSYRIFLKSIYSTALGLLCYYFGENVYN